jgi:hypothetical protein
MSTKKTSRSRARKAPMARGDGRPDALASAFEPKAKWRTLRSEQFVDADVHAIDELLDRTVIFGREDWRAAVDGDPAAAIRLVITFMPVREITIQIDLAMTALLRLAVGGDAAAAAALSFVLRNLPGRSALHRDISNSWLVRNALTAYGKSGRRPVA